VTFHWPIAPVQPLPPPSAPQVRHVAVVGHIHHGKTTVMDMLVEQVGAGRVRATACRRLSSSGNGPDPECDGSSVVACERCNSVLACRHAATVEAANATYAEHAALQPYSFVAAHGVVSRLTQMLHLKSVGCAPHHIRGGSPQEDGQRV
jgi:hypothetical protein